VQNLSQAVVGVSAQQDAAMQITFAQGTADEAARQFLSQQGLQAEQVTRENINGIPAVAGFFQAQTEQGVVRGLATFMTYGGNTYQVLSYAPAQVYPQHDRAIRQALGSFSAVNDPNVLNVRPNTVNSVRLTQNTTLAAFNQQYPSAVSLEELALINQLSSASETVPAGSYLKQVTKG
jgi:predicted Zn-dependent protease